MNTHAHTHADHSAPPAGSAHAHHLAGAGQSLPGLTTSATIHCLVGCAIGELAGLAIGVTLGWGAMATMALATVLAYVSGFALSLRPLMAGGLTLRAALRSIWLGEAISIGVMEVAMNATDYLVGGMGAASIASPIFWGGYAAALVAGFLAGWPVNYWMLSRNVKQACH
jgi:hypothetical protein